MVSIKEATGRGLSIPKILATPQATLEIAARVALTDQRGNTLTREEALNLVLKWGTGVQLLPPDGDEDRWVPTAQMRAALRSRGLVQLARQAAKEVVRMVADVEEEKGP